MTTPIRPVSEQDRQGRIRRNLAKMKAANAPQEHIDAYIASERVTPEQEMARMPRSMGENIQGAGRAALQGVTMGFGDEAEALVRSLKGPESYGEEVGNIRGQMREFREANPKTAIGLEVAGGLTAPAALGARAVQGGGRIARALASSVGQGAISGAGTAEGGLGARATGAGIGGAVGGALGAAGGALAAGATRMGSRVLQGGRPLPSPAMGAIATAANRAGVADVQGAVRQAAQTGSPETRVMDVLGTPGARMASGLRLVGGRSGQTIEDEMQGRLAGRTARMQGGLYGQRTQENVVQTIDDMVEARRAAADPLYDAALGARTASGARDATPIVDEEIESYLTRPLFANAVRKAENSIKNRGGRVEYMDMADGTRVPVRTPEFLDNVKKALDDVIYAARKDMTGGFGPGEIAEAKQIRGEFVNLLDQSIPGYAQARAAWAGPTALKGALEDGLDAASSRVDVNVLAKQVGELTQSEQEFFRRGYMDRLRQRVDDGALKPAEINTDGFAKRMDAVFGPEGVDVTARLREEVGLDQRANRVLSGSQTAERQQDVEDLAQDNLLPRAIRALGEPLRTTARAADWVESRARAPITEGRRQSVANALMTPVGQAEPLLRNIGREQTAQRQGERIRGFTAPMLARLFGAGAVNAVTP